MEDVDKEISEMKLSLNARARIVAESYLTAVSSCLIPLTPSSLIFVLIVRLVDALFYTHLQLYGGPVENYNGNSNVIMLRKPRLPVPTQ
jgi:hypothetical protein